MSNAQETFEAYSINGGAHGRLNGLSVRDPSGQAKCRRFLGIPYAQPPIGDLRWKPPVPIAGDAKWNDIDATQFAPIALQPEYRFKRPDGLPPAPSTPPVRQSESCLHLNIWTPASSPPSGGWPVYVYIHGGWLQIGHPAVDETNDPSDLISEAGMEVVIVAVGYRLGVLGFLASKELAAETEEGWAGNYGFLDQRCGLEWVAGNIHHFGGNPNNITLGGLSAGAHSTQLQLCHEFNYPVRPLIKRVIQYSNALPAQPKSVAESQGAFDALLEACQIDAALDGKEKMRKLRAVPAEELVGKVMGLDIHTFRACSDGHFIHKETMQRILDGRMAHEFNNRNLSIILGEVEAEELLYGSTNPPSDMEGLRTQMLNYYKASYVDKTLKHYALPEDTAADRDKLQAEFGQMLADGQVYVPERVLIQSLLDAGVTMDRILRYRISWKPACELDKGVWPGKVTHADDSWAWWYSKRKGFSDADCKLGREWLKPVLAFMRGETAKASQLWWGQAGGPHDPKMQRTIRDGSIGMHADDRWPRCMDIEEHVRDDDKPE